MRLAGKGVCLMEGKRADHEDRSPEAEKPCFRALISSPVKWKSLLHLFFLVVLRIKNSTMWDNAFYKLWSFSLIIEISTTAPNFISLPNVP